MRPARKPLLWIVAGIAIVAAVSLYRHFEPGQLLTLDSLKASLDALVGRYQAQPLSTVLGFFAIYVAAA